MNTPNALDERRTADRIADRERRASALRFDEKGCVSAFAGLEECPALARWLARPMQCVRRMLT